MKKYWEKPICGIYRISRRDSDKSYIGQSRDIFKRWKEHSNFSRKKLSCISSALKLYCLQSFVWEVIEECSPEELNDREVYWISYFNSMSPNGYNLTSGGGQGITVSEEVRAKMSESIKASMTEEVRAKLSEAHRGKTLSEEHRAKLSESIKAAMTEEHRAKISEISRGRIFSEETRAKLSEAMKAKKITCPHCSKKGQVGPMVRWHFDNCKLKPQSPLESETVSTSVEQSNRQDQQS